MTPQDVLKLLDVQDVKLTAVSTVSPDGSPHGAISAYYVEGDAIITATHQSTRKWENLRHDPHISLTFGWSFDEPHVQCDGIAELVSDGPERDRLREAYLEAHPETREFESPDTGFIRITPKWFRVTEFSGDRPPRVTEVAA